jgi:putative transposase
VKRYMPKKEAPPGSQQRWRTFIRNHMHESLAIDFAVVPTITFEIIYLFFVLSVDRRRILHFNVTMHPTASWTAQQVVAACPFEVPGRFLFRDNHRIYGAHFRDRVDGLGLTQVRTAYRSPWQNPFAERWIGALRRDCLNHVIAINEDQLRRVIRSYIDYFHEDRTHLGLRKDTPLPRAVEQPEMGTIVRFPRVRGLHHRYGRREEIAA